MRPGHHELPTPPALEPGVLRLVALGGIGHGDNNFLLTVPAQVVSDIETETVIAAAMLAGFTSVDEDARLPVHRLEVQPHSLAAPGRRRPN